ARTLRRRAARRADVRSTGAPLAGRATADAGERGAEVARAGAARTVGARRARSSVARATGARRRGRTGLTGVGAADAAAGDRTIGIGGARLRARVVAGVALAPARGATARGGGVEARRAALRVRGAERARLRPRRVGQIDVQVRD